MIRKLLLLLIPLCMIGCTTIQNDYEKIKPKQKTLFIQDTVIEGVNINEIDSEVLKRAVWVYFAGKGFKTVEDESQADYKVSLSLFIRPVGYNIFLLRNVFSIFIDLSIQSGDEEIYRSISSKKVFFAPQDYKLLHKIMYQNLRKSIKVLAK